MSRQRTPSHTAANATMLMANAISAPPEPRPHTHLRPQDRPFWDDIMRARSRDEWGRTELTLAAQLARVQADIFAGAALVDSGDRVAMADAGFPSIKTVQINNTILLGQQMTLMRALKIVGGVVGDPEMEAPRRQAEREAEHTINRAKVEGEGLLAT